MNIDNLKKLADYLLSGNLKAEFDMQLFSEDRPDDAPITNCGTVGCAIGHGPYAGIEKYGDETWEEYSDREFICYFSNEWHWCFSALWAQTDNTPEGAGKRILWLLEYGLPKDWNEQMWGRTKLCYK